MNTKKMINYFKMYIKSIYKQIIIFVIIMCCFFTSSLLYNSLIPATMYAIYVSTFFEVIYLIIEFIKFYSKYSFLQRELHNTQLYTESSLFDDNQIEKTYQKLLLKFQHRIMELEKNINDNKQEQEDYYNLWVHEIKTPLFALDLLIKNKIIDTDTRLQFQQELLKIEQYIDRVLQYLRIESLSEDLKLEYYNLFEVVKEAIKKYTIIFVNKNLELKLDEFNYLVLTDEKWLLFIIEQILSNSLKYTHSGFIHIYFDTDLKELIIEDTGIGIAPEDVARIFENSFTGFNGRLDKKSTGMGLYLCKKVADKLTHKIIITSTMGKGTTVKIRFNKINLEIY